MKTQGTKAYRLFHKCVKVLSQDYKFYPKGINGANLHAVFTDTNYYTYAVKVVLNESTKVVETYLAISNSYTHESLNLIKTITDLHQVIKHSQNLREAVKRQLAIESVKKPNE